MKNFWFAHFCTWIWNPPVISLLLFAGLGANIKCSLLLKLKNQQPIPRSHPDIKCWVISCLGDRSSLKCLLSHQIKYIFFFLYQRLSRAYSSVIMRWIPIPQGTLHRLQTARPLFTHTHTHGHTHGVNANSSAQLMKQILFYLLISIYQTYPILFFSTNSINSPLHILSK